ncbi:MAG: hypothetical protein K2X72_07705 [Reyranella sp.]|nr:hypothetical protein [Reyranella sp.]
MKIDHSSTFKLRAATKLWRSLNPECSVSGARIAREDLSFEAVRALCAGVAATWLVSAWKRDDGSCTLRVRMGLYDERVNALRSTALGSDTSTDCEVPTVFSLTDGQPDFLDFDVLTVSSMMDGQETQDYPPFESNIQIEQLARVVGDISTRIDHIWNFVGGPSVQGLERLSIWVLRNSDVGTLWHTLLGGICGAFAYGEKELAHELIAQLMSEWEEFRRFPSARISDVYDHVCRQIERLQEVVKRPNCSNEGNANSFPKRETQ